MEGFLRLMHTQLGYDPHRTMVIGIPLHDHTSMAWEERAAYGVSRCQEKPPFHLQRLRALLQPPQPHH